MSRLRKHMRNHRLSLPVPAPAGGNGQLLQIAPAGDTCGACKHWHDQGGDPQNVAAPHVGQCREQPHLVPIGQTAQGAVMCNTIYANTTADFAACGRFARREGT